MPDRFPADVVGVLADAGWSPTRAGAATPGPGPAAPPELGLPFEAFPAAVDALREFAGLCVVQDGAGVDVRRRPFLLDPTEVVATTQTLADFGAVLGCRLFPLGMEGDHESIIAIAETGHVFALDPTGEWHLGDSIDAALVTLITGTMPPRVTADGSW